MTSKRQRTTPRDLAIELFQNDIVEDTLTDEGDFTLAPCAILKEEMLSIVLKQVDPKHVYIRPQGAKIEVWCSYDDEIEFNKRQESAKVRAGKDFSALALDPSVVKYVSKDLHSQWTRITQDLTRNLCSFSLFTCVRTNEGLFMQGELADMTGADVCFLHDYPDVTDIFFFVADKKLMTRMLVVPPRA